MATSNPDAWNRLGHIQKRLGHFDKAKLAYRKVLELAGENNELQAVAYCGLGSIYFTRGDLDKACEYWQESLQLFIDIGAQEKIDKVNRSIAKNCKEKMRMPGVLQPLVTCKFSI